MTHRDLSTLKTSSILFVGGFLFMSALALLGSAGTALGSPQASDAGRDHAAQLAWDVRAEAEEPPPLSPLAPG